MQTPGQNRHVDAPADEHGCVDELNASVRELLEMLDVQSNADHVEDIGVFRTLALELLIELNRWGSFDRPRSST